MSKDNSYSRPDDFDASSAHILGAHPAKIAQEERGAIETLLQNGDAEVATELLAKRRIRRPDNAETVLQTLDALRASHGPQTALDAVGGVDACAAALGAALPLLAATLREQGHQLQEARLLLARQSAIIDRLIRGMHRLQGINDHLAGRAEALESLDRTASIYREVSEPLQAFPGSPRIFKVLFVSGDPDSPSHEYRVTAYIDLLADLGIKAEWCAAHEAESLLAAVKHSSIVVFWRVALRPSLMPCLTWCRLNSIPTVFDVDDYVFEPRIATPRYIDGIRHVPEKDLKLYHWGVNAYRSMLLECDAATVTTEFLAERVRDLGRQAWVLPNGVDRAYYKSGLEAPAPRNSTDRVIIGYTPGSRTHQRDFRVCSMAVARVLQENPNVRLRIIGPLDLEEFAELTTLGDQIETDPTLGRAYLREQIPNFDIHIAPVEVGNPFTEAKSELKFFEPAMFSIPTVASATQPFRDAIRNGENGYTAVSEDDWYQALTKLICDPESRRATGEAAKMGALRAFGPETLGPKAVGIYRQLLTRARAVRGFSEQTLSVAMILPQLTAGSGGHSKAISFMRGLSELGHQVRLHFTEPSTDYASPDMIRQQFSLQSSVVISEGEIAWPPVDVVIATFWKTAHLIAKHKDLALVRAYLMQDYEPLFYSMSDDYIGAEQSYKLGLNNISYGPWVKVQVEKRHGTKADMLPFFIDQKLFRPSSDTRDPDKIIMLYRPEMGRRLTHIALQGVDLFLKRTDRHVEVVLFGSWADSYVPFHHINRRVISPDEMASLFREGGVGLAISSTNPSMVPYEMLACGLPVIDINYGDNAVNYAGCQGVHLVEPTPDAIANGIGELIGDADRRARMAVEGWKFIRQFPSELEVMDQFNSMIANYVRKATTDCGRNL